MVEHPSTLALDRHSLGAVDPAVHQHVAGCERCRAYLGSLQRDPGAAPVLRPRTSLRWGLLAAAMAGAALVGWVAKTEPYIGTKGAPSVAVWVRGADGVHPWAGEALRPGDSVRLEVAPGPYREVEVRSGGAVLYRGALGEAGALPVSWTLDAAPGAEVLHIVLTGEPDPWSTTLEIPKEVQ